MLTADSVAKLVILLKELDTRNVEWDYDWHRLDNTIKVFNVNFKFSKSEIARLGRYIATYDEMVKNEIPRGYNNMIKTTLTDLKEKCGIRNKLMNKLFKVLDEDLPKPDSSNVDDVQGVPPPDIVDKGA